jgi:hypothetical protein
VLSIAVAEIENLANPVINGPYDPPAQHFEIGDDGSPTGTLIPGRRPSQSWSPIDVAASQCKHKRIMMRGTVGP